MSDAAEEAIGQEEETPTLTFAEQVNKVVGDMVQKEDGTWELPEGEFSDELKYAVVSEKRRRDMQSVLGKTQHELALSNKEREALKTRLTERVQINMSAEEQEEMQELKFSDPDKWRERMNTYEQRAKEELENELGEVKTTVTKETELERRQRVLDEFNAANPDLQITDEVIAYDVPPRITKKLEDGTISFDEFLGEVKDYLSRGKVIKKEKTLDQPNLNDLGGSDKAEEDAIQKDITTSYAKEIY